MEQNLTQSLPLAAPRKRGNSPASRIFKTFVWTSALITLGVLALILGYIFVQGIPALSPALFSWTCTTSNNSMLPSIINTLLTVLLTLAIALFCGIGAAVYLNEYMRPGSKAVKFLMAVTETLAGVPSIVFGLFGMLFFVKALNLKLSLLSGCLTLALMVLPTIIQTTREALIALPSWYREGSYGLGAGKLRTVTKILIPAAMPGILSGVILSTGRIIGETAALIYTSGTIAQIASTPMEPGSTLAVHMYKLMSEGLYMKEASAVAVVLAAVVFLLNMLSSLIEKKLAKS